MPIKPIELNRVLAGPEDDSAMGIVFWGLDRGLVLKISASKRDGCSVNIFDDEGPDIMWFRRICRANFSVVGCLSAGAGCCSWFKGLFCVYLCHAIHLHGGICVSSIMRCMVPRLQWGH